MGLFRPTYRDKQGKLRSQRVWWLELHEAGRRRRVSLGVRDKRAAEMKAAEILRAAERRAAGLAGPCEAAGPGRCRNTWPISRPRCAAGI